MIDIGYLYYFFGSSDSLDVDVLIDHPEAMADETKDKAIFDKLEAQYPSIGAWNANIVRIEQGTVVSSIPSKGSPDSVHNSLFYTYNFHAQMYPCPLTNPIERDLVLAIIKCVRAILSYFKRTNRNDFYKKNFQKVLRTGSWEDRTKALSLLDYEIPFYNELAKNLNIYKGTAFYIGQTLSLIDRIEIYTKDALILHHPDLAPIIRRQPGPVNGLLKEKINLLQNAISVLQIEQIDKHIIRFNGTDYDYKHEIPLSPLSN